MKIEKVNGFWVPSNDIHIEQWKSGQPFTQNKCLLKFLDYCESQHKKFRTVLDIGAWCGTWAKAMEPYAKKIIAFEPDATHFECLEKNCTVNCVPRREAVGDTEKLVSLTKDDFTQAKRVLDSGTIRMVALDDLGLEDVDLIKIDVEGYEMQVLMGAKKLLQTVNYVMIELNNNTKKYGSSNADIERHLRTMGYKELLVHWPDKVYYRAT